MVVDWNNDLQIVASRLGFVLVSCVATDGRNGQTGMVAAAVRHKVYELETCN